MANAHLREITLGQLLDETVGAYPEQEAVVYVDRDYRQTWAEFGAFVDDLARGLMALGIEHGEKVAIWATNVPYWVAMQFATAKIGAVLLTVNTNYKRAELKYLLQNSETENIFFIDRFREADDYLSILYDLIPELKTTERGSWASADFPRLKRVCHLGSEKHRGMFSIPEVIGMGRVITDEAYRFRQAQLSPHDVVNMQYTSGTTGFPKGVMLTHYNILNNGFWIGEMQRFTEKDRLCLTVPLFHCFGCVLGVLAAVSHGTCMVILETFNPVLAMTSVEQEKCTALYGVPTMFSTSFSTASTTPACARGSWPVRPAPSG
jgi:fatty-acyl-CoA synthase